MAKPLKSTTVARIGSMRVRRIGKGPLHEILHKGEKFGDIFGSKDSAMSEAKRRKALGRNRV